MRVLYDTQGALTEKDIPFLKEAIKVSLCGLWLLQWHHCFP